MSCFRKKDKKNLLTLESDGASGSLMGARKRDSSKHS